MSEFSFSWQRPTWPKRPDFIWPCATFIAKFLNCKSSLLALYQSTLYTSLSFLKPCMCVHNVPAWAELPCLCHAAEESLQIITFWYTIGPNNFLDIANLNVVEAHCYVNKQAQFQLTKGYMAETSWFNLTLCYPMFVAQEVSQLQIFSSGPVWTNI